MDDSLPPPNDLDLINDDLVRHHGADSGYLDTSLNSDDSFSSSPPQLTALYPAESDASDSEDAHNPNIEEESEMPSPPASNVEDDEPPNLESSSNYGEGCSSSTFEMTTVDGLMLSFTAQNDTSSDPNEDCFDQPPLDEGSDKKDLEFEDACSGLIEDLERLAQQPRKRMREEHSRTKVSKACRLPSVEFDVQMPPSSFQAVSYSAVEMPKVKIVLFDFVSGLKSRNNWKESYLTGLFRVDGATGEIEPLEPAVTAETRNNQDQGCSNDRQSLLQKIAILEMNLAKHEQCIDGLARQHTQLLKIFNKKDRKIERLKQKLKISKKKYKRLAKRLKRSNVPEIQSLLDEEESSVDYR